MNKHPHDPETSYRSAIQTLDGQLIATGSITLGDMETDGEFSHDAGFEIRDISKHQIVQAVIEGRTYRLKDFRLCHASVFPGSMGHFDFRRYA